MYAQPCRVSGRARTMPSAENDSRRSSTVPSSTTRRTLLECSASAALSVAMSRRTSSVHSGGAAVASLMAKTPVSASSTAPRTEVIGETTCSEWLPIETAKQCSLTGILGSYSIPRRVLVRLKVGGDRCAVLHEQRVIGGGVDRQVDGPVLDAGENQRIGDLEAGARDAAVGEQRRAVQNG